MHESHLHHIQYKTRLPRAPSSFALNTSRGGRGIHNLSGQPIPASHHSLWKEQSHLTSHLQLKTTSLGLTLATLSKNWLPSCL